MSNDSAQELNVRSDDSGLCCLLDSIHVKNCGICWKPEYYLYLEYSGKIIILNTLIAFSRLKFRPPKYLRCHLIYLIVQQFYPIIEYVKKCPCELISTSNYLGQIIRPCCFDIDNHFKLNNSFYCTLHLKSITDIQSFTGELDWSHEIGMFMIENTFGFIKKTTTGVILDEIGFYSFKSKRFANY